jgi:hypothetical protein
LTSSSRSFTVTLMHGCNKGFFSCCTGTITHRANEISLPACSWTLIEL